MAASTAISGYGTTIGYCATSNGSYTTLAEVRKITPPTPEVKSIEVSNLSSPGEWRERIPGFKDAKSIKFTLAYTPTQKSSILGLLGVLYYWKITFPTGTPSTWAGYGFLMSVGDEIDFDNDIVGDYEVMLTGAPTFTA